tara:strand:+ start:2485 stop:5322 length:2838 start_codon:yes stop_codon:yes gene_type:complete
MNDFDLISHVVPEGGWYCAVGIDANKNIHTKFTKDKEELTTYFEHMKAANQNVFFGCGKYKEDASKPLPEGGRKAVHVESLQALWLDIDCGEGKSEKIEPSTGLPEGYETQTEGLKALNKFISVVGLEPPTLVSSGYGWHAYWSFTEEIPKQKWIPVADRFKEVCIKQGLCADPRVFEPARILRVPKTFNHKRATPAEVTVRHEATRYSFDEIRELLGVEEDAIEVEPSRRELSVLEKLLSENETSSFSRIMQLGNDGCRQLIDCYRNRKTLSEPRWFNALSIAWHCKDKHTAIHKLSKGHPDYDPEAVERKVSTIKGPHSCEQFQKNNPKGCEGCPHLGTEMDNPIKLGSEVERDNTSTTKYPEPYFRGANGGIYIQGDGEDTLVYEHDLYVKKRMCDPELGDVAVFVLKTPQDGVKTFVIQNKIITESRALKGELAKHGVVAHESQAKLITQFIIKSIKELQVKRKADIMRVQFGWHENDTKFVVGEREITVDGVYHTPASSVTEAIAPYMDSAGTLEKWKEVMNLYDRPGLEVQAFAALTGFGAPLLKFTGQKGALINLIHSSAGTGKTTVLRMANSVCGHPELLLGNPEDTAVAKITKLGLLNNVVNTMDELTNMKPEVLSQFAYLASQGKGKDKGDPYENKLRVNKITWNTISLTTSNASFYQKLEIEKNSPDGEMMRIIEFSIPYTNQNIISTEEGKTMFDHQLNENYGHAIVDYMQYIISDMDEVKKLLKQVQQKIDKELKLTSRERNWSAIIAANITGGIIARKLKLIDYDMGRIYKEVVPVLAEMKKDTQAPVNNGGAIVGDFINRHIHNMLVVNDDIDKRSQKPKAPDVEPRGELIIRYEPDTRLMFIPVSNFKKDCMDYQVDYRSFIKQETASGMCKGTDNKRLSKGMSITSSAVRCVIFDCTHSDFVDVNKMVEEQKESGSGEGDVSDKLEEV